MIRRKVQVLARAKAEEEVKGVKRSIDEWESFPNKLKSKAEQRMEESNEPGEVVDVDYTDVVDEIGAVPLGESDVKFDEVVFELLNSMYNEKEEMY